MSRSPARQEGMALCHRGRTRHNKTTRCSYSHFDHREGEDIDDYTILENTVIYFVHSVILCKESAPRWWPCALAAWCVHWPDCCGWHRQDAHVRWLPREVKNDRELHGSGGLWDSEKPTISEKPGLHTEVIRLGRFGTLLIKFLSLAAQTTSLEGPKATLAAQVGVACVHMRTVHNLRVSGAWVTLVSWVSSWSFMLSPSLISPKPSKISLHHIPHASCDKYSVVLGIIQSCLARYHDGWDANGPREPQKWGTRSE